MIYISVCTECGEEFMHVMEETTKCFDCTMKEKETY